MLKKTILLFTFLFSFGFVQSQEQLGVHTDNYLPVNQMSINPASMVDQKPWLSMNFVGAHAFARSNFFSIKDSRLGFGIKEDDLAFDAPNRNGKAYFVGRILGPSITMNWREHAFGLHTGVRSYANINKIPAVLGEIIADEGVENIEDGVYQVRNGRVKAMTWAEVGLSYGKIIYKRDRVMINAAGTLNRIIGIQQSSLIIKDAEAEVENGEGTLRNIDGKYAYAEPNWGAGKGWGLNAGVTYKKMLIKDNINDYFPHSRRGGCKSPDYLYKVGVSLLDFGYIRFKQESRSANISDTATVDDLEDAEASVLGVGRTRFATALPTAISVQGDYRFEEGVYLNGTIVQKLSLARTFGVERANVLALTPRYESSWFSAALPLSMMNYTTPQLGLYLRFGPLAIGTDHLSPYIIKRDIKAADLYVYLNIPIKKSPECRDEKAKDVGKWFCPVW